MNRWVPAVPARSIRDTMLNWPLQLTAPTRAAAESETSWVPQLSGESLAGHWFDKQRLSECTRGQLTKWTDVTGLTK